MISSPSAGSTPTTRGSVSRRNASSRVTVSSVIGNRRSVVAALEVGPVPADPHDELGAVAVDADGDGVDLARIDLVELLRRQLQEARRAVAEVEAPQPRHPLHLPPGDLVEVVL